MAHQLKPRELMFLLVFGMVLFVGSTSAKECIKTNVGLPCKQDSDCRSQNELHLYCNRTKGANVCTYGVETYIGHAAPGVDCEGAEYSAEPWTNPVPQGLLSLGIDCMRMCLHIKTCFGIAIYQADCFLKNDKCFANLKRKQGSSIGVLNVVREDYRCGCHYPFTRTKSDGQTITWNPECPESQLTRNPFRCCSERGLCTECGQKAGTGNETEGYDSERLMGHFRIR